MSRTNYYDGAAKVNDYYSYHTHFSSSWLRPLHVQRNEVQKCVTLLCTKSLFEKVAIHFHTQTSKHLYGWKLDTDFLFKTSSHGTDYLISVGSGTRFKCKQLATDI